MSLPLLCLDELTAASRIAVAVSGGADSMALAYMLRAEFPKKEIFAYTVDHGLRNDSAYEAGQVGLYLGQSITHRTLTWAGDKPSTGLQEEARAKRYDLLQQACAEDDITVLCTAHHSDDQAETILHRLAKGSGVDGLGGIKPITFLRHPGEGQDPRQTINGNGDAGLRQHDGILLLRPLLDATHDELLNYCRKNRIGWVEDPSNENEKFARVRLRKTRAVLESEGLTNERLVRLAARMQQASSALDHYTQQEWQVWLIDETPDKIRLAWEVLKLPADIVTRLVLKAADHLGNGALLRGNLKRLDEFMALKQARKRISLGRLIITFDQSDGITVERELI